MQELIAVARVSAVYPESMTAKVYREEKELVTKELTISQRGDEWIPEVGDYVLCVFLPNGSSSGYIIGGA